MKRIIMIVAAILLAIMLAVPVAAQYSDYEPPTEWPHPPPVTAAPPYTG